jgi:hypothetical protein
MPFFHLFACIVASTLASAIEPFNDGLRGHAPEVQSGDDTEQPNDTSDLGPTTDTLHSHGKENTMNSAASVTAEGHISRPLESAAVSSRTIKVGQAAKHRFEIPIPASFGETSKVVEPSTSVAVTVTVPSISTEARKNVQLQPPQSDIAALQAEIATLKAQLPEKETQGKASEPSAKATVVWDNLDDRTDVLVQKGFESVIMKRRDGSCRKSGPLDFSWKLLQEDDGMEAVECPGTPGPAEDLYFEIKLKDVAKAQAVRIDFSTEAREGELDDPAARALWFTRVVLSRGSDIVGEMRTKHPIQLEEQEWMPDTFFANASDPATVVTRPYNSGDYPFNEVPVYGGTSFGWPLSRSAQYTVPASPEAVLADTLTFYRPADAYADLAGIHGDGSKKAVRILSPPTETRVQLNTFVGEGAEATGKMFDTHFHICSIGAHCARLEDVTMDLARAGVKHAFVFGLQARMIPGAAPWALGELENTAYDATKFRMPFHYGDPGALSLRMDDILATMQEQWQPLKERLKDKEDFSVGYQALMDPGGLPDDEHRPVDVEHTATAAKFQHVGWPVWILSQADYYIFSEYNRIGKPPSIFPCMSGARTMKMQNNFGAQYGACENHPHWVDEKHNVADLMAYDTLFPETVHCMAEHNLNKEVLVERGQTTKFDLDIDHEWMECQKDLFTYMAQTRRWIGFHCDVNNPEAYSRLMRISEAFPDTMFVWEHGGISPNVPGHLATEKIIELYEVFIHSGRDRLMGAKRYVEMSWFNGFFLRFRDEIGNFESEKHYKKNGNRVADKNLRNLTPRDWHADMTLWVRFFNKYKDNILYGSDQVDIHYPLHSSENLAGRTFLNHGTYMTDVTYSDVHRKQLSAIEQMLKMSEETLDAGVLEQIFYGNAKALADNVKFELWKRTTGSKTMTEEDARKVLRTTYQKQYDEAMVFVGNEQNKMRIEDWMPSDLLGV